MDINIDGIAGSTAAGCRDLNRTAGRWTAPAKDDREEPVGGVQMVKLGTPPGLLRFHVPAQT